MADPARERRAEPQRRLTSRIAQLCSALREILNARRVSVLLYDPAAEAVSPLMGVEPADEFVAEAARKWARIPLDAFPAARRALLEQTPVVVEDAQRDESLPPGLAADFGTTSLHLEPLATTGPVGLLAIEPATAAVNGELQAIVPLVAASAARATPPTEIAVPVREPDFVLELIEAAASARTLDDVLHTLCERAARRAGARRALAFVLEEGELQPRALVHGDGDPQREEVERDAFLRAPAPLPLAEAAVASGEPQRSEAGVAPSAGSWEAELGLEAAVAFPLGRTPDVEGALVLEDERSRTWGDDDVALLAAAAERIAGIVARARELEDRTARLEAATAVRRLLEGGARARSLQEAAETLGRVAREALSVEHASVFLVDDSGRISHAALELPDRFEAIVRERVVGAQANVFRLWRRVVRHGKPIFVDDARESQLVPPEVVTLAGLRAYVAFPLTSEERPAGLVVCSDSHEPRRWTDEQRRLGDQLALEGSLVIENVALRASERDRIDELARQAFHDPLTDLPNRSLFADRLQHALARLRRRHGSVAALLLDLDGFKDVNDTLGHEAGDQLLVAVGERLRACVRPADTVARLGGDEFTILLEEIDSLREATRVAERVEQALRTPFVLAGEERRVTASIGIALNSPGNSEPEDLLRNADTAMYQAKRAGKARYEVFEPVAEPHAPEPVEEDGEPSIRRRTVSPRDSERDGDGESSRLPG
jgi:diguanylate cyclase (GGDEF)-like protein